MLKMGPMFFSKIFVESQGSGSDATETTQEEIVLAIVEQRNHFSNKFDDFQVLKEELKNQILMATQCFERLEAQMVEKAKVKVKHAKVMAKQAKVKADQAKVRADQAKVRVDQVKVNVKEQKQQTQSQVKLLEATSGVMGETRQHKL